MEQFAPLLTGLATIALTLAGKPIEVQKHPSFWTPGTIAKTYCVANADKVLSTTTKQVILLKDLKMV